MRFRIIFLIFIILTVSSSSGISQNLPKDSVFGNVKKIREKVIFLTKQENPQIIYESDYGHMGFQGPDKTISIFNNYWYSTQLCYYINYERFFNKKGHIIKDIWYGKKDVFFYSSRYIYDKNDRLSIVIDSVKINPSEFYPEITKHYYDERDDNLHESIIHLEFNNFSMFDKYYVKGKKTRSEQHDKDGVIFDTIFKYNDNGKLDNYIFKRRAGRSTETNSLIYKIRKRIYEYDKKNRPIGIYTSGPLSDNGISTENNTKNTEFKYQGDNLITKIRYGSSGSMYFSNYKYDKGNRLIKEYCCDKNISKATTIIEYTYNKNRVEKLIFSEEDYDVNHNKFLKKHNVSFKYKYDSNNNWIEIIKTVDGVDLYKWIREIEYY